MKPDPSSTCTLSGVAMPSVAFQPAATGPPVGTAGGTLDSAGGVLEPPQATVSAAETTAALRKRSGVITACLERVLDPELHDPRRAAVGRDAPELRLVQVGRRRAPVE